MVKIVFQKREGKIGWNNCMHAWTEPSIFHRAVGRGGVRGGSLEPPFSPPKDLYSYTSKLYILNILPFKSGTLVSLLLRITAVQTSLVAATECEFVHGTVTK